MKQINVLGLVISFGPAVSPAAVQDVVPDLGERLDKTELTGANLVQSGDKDITNGRALVAKGTVKKTTGQRKLSNAAAIRKAMGQEDTKPAA